jgi:hypothetical protein
VVRGELGYLQDGGYATSDQLLETLLGLIARPVRELREERVMNGLEELERVLFEAREAEHVTGGLHPVSWSAEALVLR